METSTSAPEQNAGASSLAQHAEGQGPTRILRTILKEASVQSPLASAPSHGVFDRYSGSKGLKKLFFRTYKQKDGLLERIRAQDRFATSQEERGLICWQGHGERPDRDRKGALKFAWLNSHARIGFLVSSEWILSIECVNPSKKTSVSGFSTSGAFVQIRRYPHNSIDADNGNLGIQGSTSTNLGEEMSVRINDVPIEINVRVGPLPNYAIIEINGSSLFWWRTQEALNFVPKKTRPFKSFLDSQGYENLGVALPDSKRRKLCSNNAINRLGGSVARNEDEESFQSPERRGALAEGQYSGNSAGDAARDTVAAPDAVAAPSSTAAPPNTTKAKITDTPALALPEAGTKLVEKSLKIAPKRAPFSEEPPRLKEPPSSALPTPNWKAKLKLGLSKHKASQNEQVSNVPDQNEDPDFDGAILKKSPLLSERDLTDEEVVKGIATLWMALQNQGKQFAFGSSNTFIGCRTEGFNVDLAVKGPKYLFLMPLIFPPDSDDTEHGMPKSTFSRKKGMKRPSPGVGHHLLAVARVADGFINVTVLNSLHTCVKHTKIEEVTTSVITRSGWLGKHQSGLNPLPVWPQIRFEYPTVPTQEGVNTCGLYVILNAWATMLELKINPSRTRRRLPKKETSETPFITAVMELINLGIAGFLDTETIVAFLVSYGYVLEPQDLNLVPKAKLDQNLNRIIVTEALFEIGDQDKIALANAPEQNISDEDVQYVMDKTGCTRNCARTAVENSRGVRNIAPFFVPPERRAEHLKNL